MNLLGLNAYHADASAALVRDGELVAAAEEERFRRVKHWAGLPTRAAAWCLEEAGIGLSDVDVLAVNRDPRANLLRKALYTLCTRPDLSLVWDRLKNLGRVTSLADRLELGLAADPGVEGPVGAFRGAVHRVEHHWAHQASAYLVSPFDEAALLSVDGFGDFASASWGLGRGTEIRLDGRIHFPHSLGTFYLAMTQYLGFPRYGDEYRVMGLAPFGEPRFQDEMARVVRIRGDGTFRLDLDFFRHHTEDLDYRWEGGAPTVEPHFTPALEELLGPAREPGEPLTDRHRDVARSVQARFEEAVTALLEKVHRLRPADAVVLSGGAAMNSVMNGKVVPETPFERVFVPPAPGDAGGAVGAALAAWGDLSDAGRPAPMVHSSYGQGFSPEACQAALETRSGDLAGQGVGVDACGSEEELCRAVAAEIAAGRVVGWFQGRMEFGPRALGHRSILCDPRREDMRDRINERVKLREPFRPFAPSVLRERMGEWFEADDDVPFMMKVYPIRPEKRAQVPAVTHVDGTGRPQTVTADAHPLYHRLIQAFEEETGVPMVLNTSFNENEPIVHRPEEAVDCFLRTDMDVLALGPRVVRKRKATLSPSRDQTCGTSSAT
jgi:carbamoyltransferase